MELLESLSSTLPSKTKARRRPGGGRRPKPVNALTLNLRADQRIKEYLPLIIENLIILATGEKVPMRDQESGQMREVYARLPDANACIYLAERLSPSAPVQE